MNLLLFLSVALAVAQPGTLDQQPEVKHPQQIESLTISGNLDAKDYEFLRSDAFPNLKVLDLSGVEGTTMPPFALRGIKATDVALPANLTAIPEGLLEGSKITSAIVPEHVVTIGPEAYANCPDITQICLPSSIPSVAQNSFGNDHQQVNLLIAPPGVPLQKAVAKGEKDMEKLAQQGTAFQLKGYPDAIILVADSVASPFLNSPDYKEVPRSEVSKFLK